MSVVDNINFVITGKTASIQISLLYISTMVARSKKNLCGGEGETSISVVFLKC